MANNISKILGANSFIDDASAELWSEDGRRSDIVMTWLNPVTLYCWRYYGGQYERYTYYEPTGEYTYGVGTNSTYFLNMVTHGSTIGALSLSILDYNFFNGEARLHAMRDALALNLQSVTMINDGIQFSGRLTSPGWGSGTQYYFTTSSTSYSALNISATFTLTGNAYLNNIEGKSGVRIPLESFTWSV